MTRLAEFLGLLAVGIAMIADSLFPALAGIAVLLAALVEEVRDTRAVMTEAFRPSAAPVSEQVRDAIRADRQRSWPFR